MHICGAVKALVPKCEIVVSFIGAAFDSEAFAFNGKAHFACSAIVRILACSTFVSAAQIA
jgi:hypothetical protein